MCNVYHERGPRMCEFLGGNPKNTFLKDLGTGAGDGATFARTPGRE